MLKTPLSLFSLKCPTFWCYWYVATLRINVFYPIVLKPHTLPVVLRKGLNKSFADHRLCHFNSELRLLDRIVKTVFLNVLELIVVQKLAYFNEWVIDLGNFCLDGPFVFR